MIVLDTHVLLWWVNGAERLSPSAKAAIEQERGGGRIVVSTISAWEIAMLVERERLVLSMAVVDWLSVVTTINAVDFVPVDIAISLASVVLPGVFHKDPADRMIVATARQLGAPLLTQDEKIRTYPYVKTLW